MRLEQSLIVRTITPHLYAVAELALQTCAGYRRQCLTTGLHQYSCPVSMGTRKAVVRRRARVIRDEVLISESEAAPAQPLCISEASAGTSPPQGKSQAAFRTKHSLSFKCVLLKSRANGFHTQ